ncbi:DUF3135 domain-containing protein [Marinobacter orientalis]|uniref:DUF3135 domain-containing protein n=1 Tax=Marinobacter orientalis TaxID=1928859 RepID=A0A7Y0WTW4_9GAMM|nr:DUF3135 domain-containing protein [Marinobacter orientalis]NMT65125.1 DUF3135 domain-containing protein [Marinobacter orientalis]TGX48930.1 DUF3135 domain-containing protein [Marinobacter orientalis]
MDMPTFDELRELAQRDPEGFEILRAELIEDCICRSSECNQRRLRGLQFVIEARRRVASNPMKALLDIQAMMHDSFLSLQQALFAQQCPSEPPAPARAQVLRFRRSGSVVE